MSRVEKKIKELFESKFVSREMIAAGGSNVEYSFAVVKQSEIEFYGREKGVLFSVPVRLKKQDLMDVVDVRHIPDGTYQYVK